LRQGAEPGLIELEEPYYGRRRLYLIGMIGFLTTNALCGLAVPPLHKERLDAVDVQEGADRQPDKSAPVVGDEGVSGIAH
jgi:hypothetical protein